MWSPEPSPTATMLARKARRFAVEWRLGGPRGAAANALRSFADRLSGPHDELGVDPAVVLGPTGNPDRSPAPPPERTGSLRIGWVIGPPSAGSGGHTTLFRLIRGLQQRGHRNVIHIDDRYCPGDVATSRAVIETWFPPMAVPIVDRAELDDPRREPFDVLVATSWPTAYVVRDAPTRAARAYLVQDFEPWFHPAGSAAALAEATYRFGFHGICAGAWLDGHLERHYGMRTDHFDLGVDTETYRNLEFPTRRAVVFYARPSTPRRGFALGLLALQRLAAAHDDLDIHLFGEDLHRTRLPFPCTTHGALPPAAINELFNRCGAGLVLSFSNLSLLPFEMLAAGCVPVLNDAEHNRAVLDDPAIRYTPPTPGDLAAALDTALATATSPSRRRAARQAARRMTCHTWDHAVDQVEDALERARRGERPARPVIPTLAGAGTAS